MPRTGRFGRLPRRAPDLSGSIASMIAQYWNTQESLMVDAWKNGGEVDGQPVTDQRLLAFWRERRDATSRDDPQWTRYDNLISQYDFAIRESEVGLKYAQKDMSAREVAAWYRGEAGNYARDSEMYRTVMGQAARFMDSARAASRANAQNRKTERYNNKSQAIYDDKIAVYDLFSQGLDGLTAFFVGGQPNTSGDARGDEGADLTDLTYTTGGPDVWQMIQEVTSDPNALPGSGAYEWWQTNVVAPARELGYVGNGAITATDYAAMSNLAVTGYEAQIDLNNDNKDLIDEDAYNARATEAIHDAQNRAAFTQSFSGQEQYASFRAQLDRVRGDPNSTPEQILDAFSTYATNIASLLSPVGFGGAPVNSLFSDDMMAQGAIYRELRGIGGNPAGWGRTIAENALNEPFGSEGARDPFNDEYADVLTMSNEVQYYRGLVDNVRTGNFVYQRTEGGGWTTVPVTSLPAILGNNYAVVPVKSQGTWVMEPVKDSPGGEFTKVYLPPATTGQVIQTYPIQVRAINSAAVDPITYVPLGPNSYLPHDGNPEVGRIGVIPGVGGKPDTYMYGIWDKDNRAFVWTPDNPFVGVYDTPSFADGKFTVTFTPQVGDTFVTPNKDATKPGVFHPYNTLDTTLLGSTTYTFESLALGYMARYERAELASMSADDIMRIVTQDPTVNIHDSAQMTRLWADVNMVRQVAGLDEWGAYLEAQRLRGDGATNVWSAIPPMTYDDIQARREGRPYSENLHNITEGNALDLLGLTQFGPDSVLGKALSTIAAARVQDQLRADQAARAVPRQAVGEGPLGGVGYMGVGRGGSGNVDAYNTGTNWGKQVSSSTLKLPGLSPAATDVGAGTSPSGVGSSGIAPRNNVPVAPDLSPGPGVNGPDIVTPIVPGLGFSATGEVWGRRDAEEWRRTGGLG